jgi:hypothetical protein
VRRSRRSSCSWLSSFRTNELEILVGRFGIPMGQGAGPEGWRLGSDSGEPPRRRPARHHRRRGTSRRPGHSGSKFGLGDGSHLSPNSPKPPTLLPLVRPSFDVHRLSPPRSTADRDVSRSGTDLRSTNRDVSRSRDRTWVNKPRRESIAGPDLGPQTETRVDRGTGPGSTNRDASRSGDRSWVNKPRRESVGGPDRGRPTDASIDRGTGPWSTNRCEHRSGDRTGVDQPMRASIAGPQPGLAIRCRHPSRLPEGIYTGRDGG